MDGKVPKAMLLRNKKAPKVLNSGTPEVGNQLVRMRSPVQIWVAAPTCVAKKDAGEKHRIKMRCFSYF